MEILSDTTFKILRETTGSKGPGDAHASYVELTTEGAHGRVPRARISPTGVVAVGGAPDINQVWDKAGVIDATTLMLAVETDGTGSYGVGPNAVIGDDAVLVAATDGEGTVGGLWKRNIRSPFDVRWFGAKPNWNVLAETASDDGTANHASFEAAFATMAADGNKTNKLVADGAFYLSGGLAIERSILLEGTGQGGHATTGGAHSAPGTMLVFSKNVTGIRILSAGALEDMTNNAGYTRLRDLTVYCKERDTLGHGVHFSAPITLSNVRVENFAQNGFHVDLLFGGGDGLTDGTMLEHCYAHSCGGDGFHFAGFDAGQSLISACDAYGNLGHGFYDATRQNVYIACVLYRATERLGGPWPDRASLAGDGRGSRKIRLSAER